MRVTFAMTYDKMSYNINRKKEDIDRLGTTIASGKRLHKASDDPSAWSQALTIKQKLREFGSFESNMDFAIGWNRTTESALNHIFDLLINVRDIGVAASGPTTAEERAAHVADLNQILCEAVSSANTKYESRCIFSVNGDEAPVSLDFSTSDPDDVTGINVNGVDLDAVVHPDGIANLGDRLQVRIGRERLQTVNRDGRAVFYGNPSDPGTNLFQQILELKEAIRSGDTTAIRNGLGAMEAAQERISEQMSLTGSVLIGLDRQKIALSDMSINEQERLSNIEEGDLAEVITQLQQKRTAFEAALRVTGLLDGLSLVNFL